MLDFFVRAQKEGLLDRFLGGLESEEDAMRWLYGAIADEEIQRATAERTEGSGLTKISVPKKLLVGVVEEFLRRLLVFVSEHPIESDADSNDQ